LIVHVTSKVECGNIATKQVHLRAWILADKGGEWPRCKHGISSGGKQHQADIYTSRVKCLII